MSEQAYQAPATPDRSLSTPEPRRTGSWKTPIQVLYEHGVVSGDLPVFVMEKAEGEAHLPSFVFSVTIGGVKCTGQGPSKKAAKQQAAEAALKILNIDSESGAVSGRSNTNGVIVAEPNNPVGLLQALALQRRWHVPEYIILTESGPPHRKEFTIICRLESLTEQGVGNTKKAAKKEAAEKMVVKLQSLSGSSEITWTPNPSICFENIRNSTAEKISLLRRNPLSIPNTDYIQMLIDLSKEQGFEVTYFDIDELTVNGQYQCLAELSTSPVTVCHGTGISCSNAHNDAAHSALQYMKIMASSK